MKKLLTICIMAATVQAHAQGVNTNQDKVANNGYDIVNYFTANSAVRGSKDYSAQHNGATYYFVNSDHQKQFKASPEKYLPQFDGYCAFAVAQMNQKVPVDPKTFRVDDGKLYLFFNDFYEGKPFNTIIPWLGNENEMEKMAAENWKTLKNK
ncbi:YHS domain-containing (seleno)protein [Roseivirga sp. E12]|uniref:YHS domain-containing (seleno)protein n=1 Tax=Roseivirga sp. E12 TaxID=2819237 RepID=UPI001ABD1FFE|nr:YHS domain-containing (seleno)protein [Roseivirga sp. E12]MBO3698262.1 YHS domain protein [Roseivirga sp. E12]